MTKLFLLRQLTETAQRKFPVMMKFLPSSDGADLDFSEANKWWGLKVSALIVSYVTVNVIIFVGLLF